MSKKINKRNILLILCVSFIFIFFFSYTKSYAISTQKKTSFAVNVSKPVISTNGGTFTNSKSIKLTCSTPGAKIYYKIGSKPNPSVDKYIKSGKSIKINKSGKLYAIAVVGKEKSKLFSSKKFTIVTKSPTNAQIPKEKSGTAGYSITLKAPSNTTLYYTITTNGKTPNNPTTKNNKISAGKSKKILINKLTKIKAIAVKKGCSKSKIVFRTYAINVSKPAISINGGKFTNSKSIKLTCSTPGAKIYYKIGAKPNTSTDKHIKSGSSIKINKSGKLYAIAVVGKEKSKLFSSKKFTIVTESLTDTEIPKAKSAPAGYSIKLKAPSNATLYYTVTTNGKTPENPTTKANKISAGKSKKILINKLTKIKAIAIKKGCSKSKIVSRTYDTKVTESYVYNKIIGLKSDFPEGMEWMNDKYYEWNGGIYSGGYGCAGFAFRLSDEAFGKLPARIIEDTKVEKLRVGDIVRINNDTHSVIVIEITDSYITVAEGNYNYSVHWGRKFTLKEFKNVLDYIMTRYPE